MNQNRFADVIKILLGILIGQLIKESDCISKNLFQYLNQHNVGNHAATIANWAPVVLTIVYLRNIHGSVAYDNMVKASDLVHPSYERFFLGRVMSSVFSLMALFVVPFCTEHVLEKGLLSHEQPSLLHSPSVVALVALAIGPILIYSIWDFALWLFASRAEGRLYDAVTNWVKIDGMLLLVLIAGAIYLRISHPGSKGASKLHWTYRPDLAILALGLIVVLVIGVDYCVNAKFYFPKSEWWTAHEKQRAASAPPSQGS